MGDWLEVEGRGKKFWGGGVEGSKVGYRLRG